MTLISNPFVRGYQNLLIERTLLITSDQPALVRGIVLHESQRHLRDDEIRFNPCVFDHEFALVTQGYVVSDDIGRAYPRRGFIRDVRYVLFNKDNLGLERICECDTKREADMHIQRLRFETGHYSRAWEISTAHITDEAASYLADLADIATPTSFLFVAFRIPYNPAIGVKLIATPWWEEHLQHIEGITTEDLRQVHIDKGMPECLVDVLHLAAQADIRFLVFDADAPLLEGLPVYEGVDDRTADND